MKKLKPGDIVTHILEPKVKMVLIEASQDHDESITCRFKNPVTGMYILEDFREFELTLSSINS
jgi:hypothetical protein